MRKITNKLVCNFKMHLIEEEKSPATIEKYIRDVTMFMNWLYKIDYEIDTEMHTKAEVTKATVLEYKKILEENYAPSSVNSILSSLNSFFAFNNWNECRVKTIKIQRQIFASKDKELTKAEYERLLKAANNKKIKDCTI